MAAPPDADPTGGGPVTGGSDGARADDRPPFWSWNAIYGLVLGALALQVVVYAVLSWVVS